MITTENKYFLRIILLLYDAASFILRHIVVRELRKQGDDLDNLLKKDEFENKLKHKLHFGKSQVENLFPSNGKSDIKTWDSQMLAVVSLLIFRSTLSSDEKYHIKFLQLTRNNVAHKPSASYLEDDFVDEKERIIKAITILASGFDSTVQEKCGELISSYCSDPLDSHVQLAIKHLEEDTTNRELLRQILDTVNEKHEIVRKDIQDHAERIKNTVNLTEKKICESQETVLKSLNGLCLGISNVESKLTESKENTSQELKQVNTCLTHHIVEEAEKVSQKVDTNTSFLIQEVQRKQNEHAAKLESKLEELKQLFEQTSRIGGHCSKQIKFGTHTHLTVDGPTQEWINIVETVLKSVFDILLNNVKEPGQNPETEKAVEEFLSFIKGFKGVELMSVERKCILLAFECITCESLRELIEFINSKEFHKYLDNIARALEKDLKMSQRILILSEIPISSLQLVADDKSSSMKQDSKKGLALSFECTSIDGLDAFWRLFVKGEATPYINKIAATVSSEVKEKSSLSTSVNLNEFEDALSHLEATVNKATKDTLLLKPNKEKTQPSTDFEKDIETLKTRTDSEFSDTENCQDELTKPDPLNSVYTSVQDIKSGDLKRHSEISGKSYQRLAPSFEEREYQYEIDEHAGIRHGNKQRVRGLMEQLNISSSHQLNRFSLVYQEKITVLSDTDAYTKIYSCAILSDGRLMIADDNGLSIVNIHTGREEQKKTLDTCHSDIAVLPNDQVAVTLYWDDKIVILSTTDMSLIRSISVLYRPSGITYRQDKLYVVCVLHNRCSCVNILNLQGGILRIMKCDELLVLRYSNIAVSMDAQNLYISDDTSLIKYSAYGHVVDRYRLGEKPKVLSLLDDGSLLVVSKNIHRPYIYNIHHISADLQYGYELKLDDRFVGFIGVDPVNNLIYVIENGPVAIKVYCLQKRSRQCLSDKKLTSSLPDEKLSTLKAKTKLLSFETDKGSDLLKAGTRFPSFESDEEFASFKAGIMSPSLNTDENLTSFKAEMKLPSLETDLKLASLKAEMK